MNQFTVENQTEVCITATNLEAANLNEWERLELHLLDQAAVVIPGKMTVMDVIHVCDSLEAFAAELLASIGEACEPCDRCHMEQPCHLMTGNLPSPIRVPAQVLEEAGIDPDSKLACTADLAYGEVRICEAAQQQYDLTDLRPDLLETFRECGICMRDLEEKLAQDVVVYGEDG